MLGWWFISRLPVDLEWVLQILRWCWVVQSGSGPHGSMGDSVCQSASRKYVFALVGNNRRHLYRKLS